MTMETQPEGLDLDIHELINRAQQGDAQALQHLRLHLEDTHPIWKVTADLTSHIERALIRLTGGNNLLLTESLKITLRDQRAELGFDLATPVERLLIDRVVLSHLELYFLDGKSYDTINHPNFAEMERRRTTAHHRYLEALKVLTQVRRLLSRVGC